MGYLIYRLFETKWKRKIFDEAEYHFSMAGGYYNLGLDYENSKRFSFHIKRASELMDMIT